MKYIVTLIAVCMIALCTYGIIGTSSNVDQIKKLAPDVMSERGWEILRYEGYQFGSFGNHGGKVWYHVMNKNNPKIQYRVYVVLWGGELHFTYGEPEKLNRIDVTYNPG